MSLLGLLGRGFTGQLGEGIATPVLSVEDLTDGTGATARITEGDDDTVNTIRVARATGSLRTLSWEDAGTRTGNGTVTLALEAGSYMAVCVAELGDAMDISDVIEFIVTDSGASEFTFDKLRKHVLVNRTLDTEFFAEVISYKRENCPTKQMTAHCKHGIRYMQDPDGTEVAVEQITVTVNRDDFATEPRRGDRIVRSGETRPYIYAFAGKAEKHFYRLTFERRAALQQGSGK